MTCGFDALVHIIQFSALDSPSYRGFMEQSDNPLLLFTSNFCKSGLTKEILLERLKTLNQFYFIGKDASNTSIHPYILDAEDFIARVWSNYFSDEPSGFRTYNCSVSDCFGKKIDKLLLLAVNEKLIRRQGYGCLRKALLYHSQISNIKCREPECNGTVTENTELNIHICIELDVRVAIDSKTAIKGFLSDFPVSLELDRKYRLVGIVDYQLGHFIAYCLRSGGTWLQCDDMQKKITSVNNPKETSVFPHIAIYVLE
ncbi:uncharacterized protein LOC107043505 isoform X1 [Diachasma alloeum]|uniref:uncharacterized protein LOC107043505 isoform X1 n=1 Tax=Diachasma alloeum TaxID=454923 RepID=UPI0007382A83|nr:uncharacterized protein LOC107043505 isoform X1 [Diachasma alloeum]